MCVQDCLHCEFSKKSYPDGDTEDPLCSLECTLTGEDLGYGDQFPVPSHCPLTEEGCLYHHRKMWNWIADETLRQQRQVTKEEYCKQIGINNLYNYCYCCNYSEVHGLSCEKCLIDWGKNNECMAGDTTTPYAQWISTHSYQNAAMYARQVARLPAKKGG